MIFQVQNYQKFDLMPVYMIKLLEKNKKRLCPESKSVDYLNIMKLLR